MFGYTLILLLLALWTPYALATEERLVMYDSRDLVYGPDRSDWTYVSSRDGLCENGYIQSSSQVFCSVSLRFTGIAVSVNMIKSMNSSRVSIQLDGVRVDDVDTYLSSVDCATPVFQRSGLSWGDHTVVISVLSDLDRMMRFQSFRYTTYTADELASRPATSGASGTGSATSIPSQPSTSSSSIATSPSANNKIRNGLIAAGTVAGVLLVLICILVYLKYFKAKRPVSSAEPWRTEHHPDAPDPLPPAGNENRLSHASSALSQDDVEKIVDAVARRLSQTSPPPSAQHTLARR